MQQTPVVKTKMKINYNCSQKKTLRQTKREKSPKPNRGNEIPTTPETKIEASQCSKSDETLAVGDNVNVAQDIKPKYEEPHISEDIIEHAKAETEKIKPSKGKKSPKSQRKMNKQVLQISVFCL